MDVARDVCYCAPSHYSSLHASIRWCLRTGMSVFVPLIADPRGQLLAALPFVHSSARNQCLNAIRQTFDGAIGEQGSAQVMLHLVTQNGPMLMEMIASKFVRPDSEPLVMAGLLRLCDVEKSSSDAITSNRGADNECFRSVSEDGLSEGGPADAAEKSTIGSEVLSDELIPAIALITPTFEEAEREETTAMSTISSLTNASLLS